MANLNNPIISDISHCQKGLEIYSIKQSDIKRLLWKKNFGKNVFKTTLKIKEERS